MKKHLFINLFMIFIWNICSYGQDYEECIHYSDNHNNELQNLSSIYSFSTDPEYLSSFEIKTIRVKFWAIIRNDGTSDNEFTSEKLKERIVNLIIDGNIVDTKHLIKH